jgi:hypothetical protein
MVATPAVAVIETLRAVAIPSLVKARGTSQANVGVNNIGFINPATQP